MWLKKYLPRTQIFNTRISQYYLVFFKWYTSKLGCFFLFVCFCYYLLIYLFACLFVFAFHYLVLRVALLWKYFISYLNVSRYETSRNLYPRSLSRIENGLTIFSEKWAFKRSKLERVTIKSIKLLLIRHYSRTLSFYFLFEKCLIIQVTCI